MGGGRGSIRQQLAEYLPLIIREGRRVDEGDISLPQALNPGLQGLEAGQQLGNAEVRKGRPSR